MKNKVIPARSGSAFQLKRGHYLKVVDPQGQQVSDLFCFDWTHRTDALSSGRSIDYEDSIKFSKGSRLYSQSGFVLLEIVEDTCGVHDFLITPCSLQMFQMLDPGCKYHPSCFENLYENLHSFGIQRHQITTTFNIFMNVPVSTNGKISVQPPKSKAGDHIIFKAHCDLLVGLTACSDEGTNNGLCKPIEYSILEKL